MRIDVTDRFYRVCTYQHTDRVPDIEFGYWPQTIRRWLREGMDLELTDAEKNEMFSEKVDQHMGFDTPHYASVPLNAGMNPCFEPRVIEKRASSTMNHIIKTSIIAACVVFASTAPGAKAKNGTPTVPDFTRGGQPDESHDWTLGPTGARGWVYGWKGQTAEARQILVTAVAKGSPADGVLGTNDVILGVNGTLFTDDARIQFARAIMDAEQEKNGGVLKLVRWRVNSTANVELKLATMGTYSATAPYYCPKSRKIFEQGCRLIAKNGLDVDHEFTEDTIIPNNLNALALLASGREEYRPLLAAFARKDAAFKAEGFASWYYGYATLFLAEYVLATNDTAVTNGLHRLAREIAVGQSAVGTWGHKFARPDGNCNGYGCMNAPGIVLTIAMVVAREAGVKNAEVNRAIAMSAGYLRWYVDKGAIPYGDHQPWPGHEDNGKCSAAAVLFDLLGDREAAAFFAKMSTAGYSERERGHTGNFFNMLWAMLGVSRCGPLATGAYMKEQAWYYDLARQWDGGYVYQGSPIGEEEHRKYTGWDSSGAYLLTYAMPLKSLCITGKKPCSMPALNQKEVEEVIAAGRDYFSTNGQNGYEYTGRTATQLMAGLASWSPAVRKRSARGLARCKEDFVPTLLTMLADANRDTRYGACEALGCLGPRADAAAPKLRALLENKDPWLQSLACTSLSALGSEARRASALDLLCMVPLANPADPRCMAQRPACAALFAPYPGSGGPKGILADSLDGIDRALLYPAIRSALQNEDAVARGSVVRIYRNLTDSDLAALLPAILKAVEKLAPSDEMFGDGIRLAGLDLLSRLHIREGMPLCVSVIEPNRWGAGDRLAPCLEYLCRYGVHAKEVLPRLRELRRSLVQLEQGEQPSKNVELLDKSMAGIAAATASPTVVDVKEFIARALSGQ